MRIDNIRVLNNHKVKLINVKLTGVDSITSVVSEQGTRTPVVPTTTPGPSFQEKFDLVFDYLLKRYEPGWSGSDDVAGRTATMELLGISGATNPLLLGGSVEAAFNLNTSSDEGWFDPLVHPKDFATTVLTAYKKFDRARKPSKAQHRFVDRQPYGVGAYSYRDDGGNMFFNTTANFRWYPEDQTIPIRSTGFDENYQNKIERMMLRLPYGHFRSPMSYSDNVARQSLPWISDRYSPDSGYRFDAYLLNRENATLRDLLNDAGVTRDASLGVLVDGVTDIHLNTLYRGLSFPAGYISKSIFNRSLGGYSANEVAVGSPWISYPNGLTWSGQLTSPGIANTLFNRDTLVLFSGGTFPTNPQTITDRPVEFDTGISYGNLSAKIDALDDLADYWGNSLEFIGYFGFIPYGGQLFEYQIPLALYKDPTISGNTGYGKWRLNASVSHWKEKFKSPIDGHAHVFMDAGAAIERTFHQFSGPTYATWSNVTESGASYQENIPVSWFRDQYSYTYGGSTGFTGAVVGIELFGWYDFKFDSSSITHKKTSSDTNPRHWALDEDIAAPLYMRAYDAVVGQRVHGLTNANQIWGAGICGSSTLGEIMVTCAVVERGGVDGYPFFYNCFTEYNGSQLQWKRVPGTIYTDGNGVPWYHDRRFRLFYLYPTVLALGGTVLDIMHNGHGYYYASESGWFDISKGNRFQNDMGTSTPTKPPQNYWTGIARTSEFELLYACMKAGVTGGLDSLGFTLLYNDISSGVTIE
jgi:hypothetical protein